MSLSLSRPAAPSWAWFHRAAARWRAMGDAAQSRRTLADMTDRDLRDIGIGRADAQDEANRRRWDLRPRAR